MKVFSPLTRPRCFSVILVAAFAIFARSMPAAPLAGVYLADYPPADRSEVEEITHAVAAAGYTTKIIGTRTLTNSDALQALHLDLLVLPQGGSLAAASMEPIHIYLSHGGNLMAMGAPLWGLATFKAGAFWLSIPKYQKALERLVPDHAIVDFAHEDLSQWVRSTDPAGIKAATEVVSDGNGPALHVTVDHLESWNVLMPPDFSHPFPDGRNLTCFRARGSKDTRQMSIEWREEDGSRWITVIDLGLDWKSYALPPEAFQYWKSTKSRGGPGDHFDVSHAQRLSIGLARSHAGLPGAHHEYWIGNIGTARPPFGLAQAPDPFAAPEMDTLAPGWKFYPMHGALKLDMPAGLPLVRPGHFHLPFVNRTLPLAIQPRPGSAGFNQGRPWRWQPLIEARSESEDYRGAMAAMLMHFNDEYRGGIWVSFTPDDKFFSRQGPAQRLITDTARDMRRGVFLEEGGAEYFTAFSGQSFSLGARIIDMGREAQHGLSVRLTVKPKSGGDTAFSKQWDFDLAPGAVKVAEEKWLPQHWPNGGYSVTTELLQNGTVIDRLRHELNVWQPKPKPEFITEHDGGFIWRGRPWKANGVNYIPSTGIGDPGQNYFEYWLGKGAYDPEAIQRDLSRIQKMGLNAVSIFIYHDSMKAQHLLDFLRRCDALGLHVNQSLRPGTPLDFEWGQMRDLIEYYHLAQNDTVFAYDLAWEAEHHDEQHYYGKNWADWVAAHYGSVEKAEAAWGFKPESPLLVPPLRELAQNGPWLKMIIDYRALLDRELDEKYGEARRLIRSIDPNHAVSFRMNEAGDPTFNSEERLPFDFYGLRKAVDIWEPEGYGRIGDWEQVRQGRFDVDYARLCGPAKPFMWGEMGYTVWDETGHEPSKEKLDFQADFYRNFYQMMTEAGCDGFFCWWYPGGYRFNERSDFGIINPDGTDRPVTRVIRQESAKFLKAAKHPPGDDFIYIDRDKDSRGIYGIYQSAKKEYWQAIEDGKIPALRWSKAPGGRKKIE